jgi:hypothetical protein
MNTLKTAFGFPILHLHSVKDSFDVGFDHGRWLSGRSGDTRKDN